MAGAYLVTLPSNAQFNLSDGCNAAIVWAENATMAKDLAAAMAKDDVPAAAWAAATATALVVGTELEGWIFRIDLTDNNSPYTLITASYTAVNAADIDTVGAGLKAALIAAGIANADYNSTSNLLTIGAAGDNIGDWHIVVSAFPPTGVTSTSLVGAEDGGASGKSVSGFFGAVTAENVTPGTARTSTLVASLPAMYGMARMKR